VWHKFSRYGENPHVPNGVNWHLVTGGYSRLRSEFPQQNTRRKRRGGIPDCGFFQIRNLQSEICNRMLRPISTPAIMPTLLLGIWTGEEYPHLDPFCFITLTPFE